jgi:hypothetical protein
MDVRLPDGTVIKNVPDDMSKADLTAKLKANGYDVSKLDVAANEGLPAERRKPTLGELALATPLARYTLGAISPIVGGVQLASNIVESATGKNVTSKPLADWWNNIQTMKEKGMETEIPGSNPDLAGLTGNVTAGALMLPARALSTGQKIFEGAKIGGIFGVTQPGVTDIKQNVLGGALGTTIGAAAPVVVPALAKGMGWVVDTLTGQLTKVKAADIARKAAGDQINAIRTALAGTPTEFSPAQATVGIQKNTWQALNQLAAGTDANSVRLKAQYDDQLAALARMAEGGNATEARAAQEKSKEILNQLTANMRATELGAANQANQTVNQLAPKLAQKQAAVVQAVRQGMPLGEALSGQSVVHPGTEAVQRANVADDAARRLMVARSQAARGMVSESTVPGVNDRRIGGANQFVSEQWKAAADTFGQIANQRRAEAGFIERQIGSLADHGLQPLDTSKIIASIDTTINSPGTRASPVLTKTLQAIKDDIAALAEKNNGVIDAHDLYTLRKEGISERISQLLGPTDPKTSSKLTSKILLQLKPEIDKAIEKAGGTGWKDYLSTYSQGMQAIDQKAMAAEAMRLFQDTPDQYVKLVRGGNPDAVEAIFGKGSYDIFKEMGRKMPTLSKIATELEQNDAISAAAKAGAPELAAILDNQGFKFRFPIIGKAATLANLTIRDLEGRVSAGTLTKLREGMATNQSTLDLLNTLPTVDKNIVLSALANYGNPPSKAVTATVLTQPTNALAGAVTQKPKQNNLR